MHNIGEGVKSGEKWDWIHLESTVVWPWHLFSILIICPHLTLMLSVYYLVIICIEFRLLVLPFAIRSQFIIFSRKTVHSASIAPFHSGTGPPQFWKIKLKIAVWWGYIITWGWGLPLTTALPVYLFFITINNVIPSDLVNLFQCESYLHQ